MQTEGLIQQSKIEFNMNFAIPLFFLVLLGSVLYSREFPGPDGPATLIYSHFLLGFRWIDVILFVSSLFFTVLICMLKKRSKFWGIIGKQLAMPTFLFFVSVFISMLYGIIHGGKNIFYEWRAIILGLITGSAFRAFLNIRNLYKVAYTIFWLISTHSLFLLIKWISSGGVPPFNGPIFDGPTLSNAVAGSCLGIAMLWGSYFQRGFLRKFLYVFMIATNIILVISALRRTYWIELLVSIGIFFLILHRHVKFWIVGITMVTFAIGITVTSTNKIWARIMSIVDFTDVTNHYASTNIGHLEDVLDAIYQIQKSPILGIGLGTTYETIYTSWKTESWGTHNGPLHVWLRFGLLGLLSYLWFHWRVFSLLWHQRKLILSRGLLAYCLAIFVPTILFSPWPYGALQNTLLLSVFFALVDTEITYSVRNARNSYHS